MTKVSKSVILHFNIQRFYNNKNMLCKPFCKHKKRMVSFENLQDFASMNIQIGCRILGNVN